VIETFEHDLLHAVEVASVGIAGTIGSRQRRGKNRALRRIIAQYPRTGGR
jgi:hypothetical protein